VFVGSRDRSWCPVREGIREHGAKWAAIVLIAEKMACLAGPVAGTGGGVGAGVARSQGNPGQGLVTHASGCGTHGPVQGA